MHIKKRYLESYLFMSIDMEEIGKIHGMNMNHGESYTTTT